MEGVEEDKDGELTLDLGYRDALSGGDLGPPTVEDTAGALWAGSASMSTDGASPAEYPSTFARAQIELTPWCASMPSGRGLGMSA